jgi:hypothetical protein
MPTSRVFVSLQLVSISNTFSSRDHPYPCHLDSGAEKKKLCLSLGAENWIDFAESEDIVKDVKDITGGLGAHAAIVTTASVSLALLHYSYNANSCEEHGLFTSNRVSAKWRNIDGRWLARNSNFKCIYLLDRHQGTWHCRRSQLVICPDKCFLFRV